MPESPQRRDQDRRDIVTRSLSLRAATINERDRSVEATISTGSAVEVYDWRNGEIIDEVLLPDAAELPAQMPMLANHSRWSLRDILGSIRGLRVDGNEIVGRLHFADGEDAEHAWQMVRGGHITDVSVGYRVTEETKIASGQTAVVRGKQYAAGKRTLRIATRWVPKEGSLVPIGADQAAKIREDFQTAGSQEVTTVNPRLRAFLESIGLRREATEQEAQDYYQQLSPESKARADAAAAIAEQRNDPPPATGATPARSPRGERADDDGGGNQTVQLAIEAERNRVRQLRQLAGSDIPQDVLARAIDEGWDEARASREFLSAVRSARAPSPPATPYHASAQTAPLTNLTARSLAVGMMRGLGIADPTRHHMHTGRRDPSPADRITAQDAEQGDRFARMSAIDIVRQAVLMDTGRLHWDPSEAFEAARAAVSGGTLSYVFTTNVYAKLLEAWSTIGDTTVGWCDEEDVANFLSQEDISLAANARLEQLPRGDVAKHATVSDSKETYKIGRYAKQFVMDEQDVIDDRLGALMRMPAEMGAAARQLRPDLVYSVMLENPTMTDTGAVFNATAITTAGGHANLGTAALSSAALKAGITAMVQQRINRTSSDPGQALNLRPRFLIVPADLEWTARELTAAAALAKLFADTSDPFYAQLNLLAQEGLRVVIDDRIGAIGVMDPKAKTARTGSAKNWFLAVGGNRGLRAAYRRGTNRQPQMRSFALTQGQWGMGWDVNMDIGVAFTEWRTWYKSTGAA